MMDDNIDGKLQKAELRGEMGQRIGKFFAVIDKNGDQALDKAELAQAAAMLPGRRRGSEASNDGPTAATPIG